MFQRTAADAALPDSTRAVGMRPSVRYYAHGLNCIAEGDELADSFRHHRESLTIVNFRNYFLMQKLAFNRIKFLCVN